MHLIAKMAGLAFFLLFSFKAYSVDMNVPAVKLKSDEAPLFKDDLELKGIELAFKRQKAAFRRSRLSGSLTIAGRTYKLSIIEKTVKSFEKEVEKVKKCFIRNSKEECWERFNYNLKRKFDFYRPIVKQESGRSPSLAPTEKNFAHFTGYYSPTIKGSLVKTEEFPFAIYTKPKTEKERRYTREQIIFENKLEGKGLNLFYIKDLFALYLLHLEGGGRVEIQTPNGPKMHYLSYQAHNSNKFTFLSKYMRKKGMIDDSSIDSQRRYLAAHPERWREIYSFCPGYIYFTITKTEPLGLEDIPLTQRRSLAQDRKIYKRKGMLAFVRTLRPIRNEEGDPVMTSYSRFYLDQDTGSAIKGEARADLYWGYGDEAELAANTMNERGEIFFLLAK
ncbi:MAG: hypothetical protein CME70_16690 [Halobacteriovorax sp.]|nr:hypothetical protein [Halobacteriovorax sp.]|tara:strand:+ start:85027 stop:86196 length:1170 start_codon:yes stop_codon:yes gene_type:complete